MKISFFEYIFLIITGLVIFLYALACIRSPNLNSYIKKYNSSLNWVGIKELYKDANNGDLIFMCGNTRGERICRWCTNSMYSHVGILFREKHPETNENLLYIWDSDLGQKTKDGPRVQLLKDKLKEYHGYPYLMWRKLYGERPKTNDILSVIKEYSHQEFDHRIFSWWVSDSFLYRFVKDDNKSFCSELTALTLQHKSINILDNKKVPAWYSPGSFEKDEIFGLKPGYEYGTRMFVEFKNYDKSKI